MAKMPNPIQDIMQRQIRDLDSIFGKTIKYAYKGESLILVFSDDTFIFIRPKPDHHGPYGEYSTRLVTDTYITAWELHAAGVISDEKYKKLLELE